MFIYRFNQLIKNKILWGFFAIIIAIAFVAVDCCYRSPDARRSAGSINGNKITAADFENAVRAIRGFGRNRDNETPVHVIDRRAWEQIAAEQTANKDGLATTQPELRQAILEMFQAQNGFDMNLYSARLREMGLNPAAFEDLMRRQLSVQKCLMLANSASWVSPMELDDQIAGMTDKFTVQYAAISNTFKNAEIKQSDDDYKKYYEENKASYALPDQVQVRYVEIPASNYVAFATVDESDMQDYYDSNSDKYMHTTSSNTTETVPFEKVKDEIMAELKLEAASYIASTALSFQVFGYLAADTNASPLAKLAAETKSTIKTSPLFGSEERLAWAEDSQKVSETAFDLDMEGMDSRIGVAACTKKVYVMELIKKNEAHTPELKDVLDQVKQQTLNKARNEAFDKKCKEAKEALEKAVAAGKKFADAAKEQGMVCSTSVTYTVNEIQNSKFDNSFTVAYGSMGVRKGKISDALPASGTQSLFVYVADRQPGDALAEQMVRSQLRANLSRRGGANIDGWLKWNLDQQKFEPRSPLVPEDAKEDEPEAEAEAEAEAEKK